MENILFYDIEVFRHDALVVFMDEEGSFTWFWSDPSEPLNGFAKMEKFIGNRTLIGYNNFHYDDHILCYLHNSDDLVFSANNSIINGTGGYLRKTTHSTRDCMQQLLMFPSLKQVEGNMGLSIEETPIDFTHEEKLTEAEREEVLHYCMSDVRATAAIYRDRKASYFDTKKELVERLSDDPKAQERLWHLNTTTLSAEILLQGNKFIHEKRILIPGKYWKENWTGEGEWIKPEWIPSKVYDLWVSLTRNEVNEDNEKKGKSITVNQWGCEVTYGLGGLHGAPSKPGKWHHVKLADVGSMYPSIICSLNLLGDATKVYDGLRQERLAIKHTDKTKANALKLVLNSVYGQYKAEHSKLLAPRYSETVCIYGQIALAKLCDTLYRAGYRIININTDGVAFVGDPALGDEYEHICRDWEQEFIGLVLEVDDFDKWIQKDVNNYVALQGSHIKTKGGEVNKYAFNNWYSNNSIRIVQIAIVEKLVFDKEPMTTFEEHFKEPILWQYILKCGKTYVGTIDRDGKMRNKVNRVFACREDNPEATRLYKLQPNGGRINFPDAPDFMLVYNGSLDGLESVEDIVNLEHYLNLVNKKLEGWNVY